MPNYSKAIEEIKDKCNIADVIGAVITLKRSGNSAKGCCPFHKEKTPSFHVVEDKGYYHCFGCGEHGDVIKFVEKYYNISFTDAVEKLAAQYNIQIEETVGSYSGKQKDPYYEANRLAAVYFYSKLIKTQNKGVSYLGKRGMNAETIKNFGVGYADNDWQSLRSYLKSKGVSDEIMLELGLIMKSHRTDLKGDGYYDTFRDRVIFPIINTRDKVIGFGGRILEKGEPKYLNSPESVVYKKKENLYGLNKSKSAIQQAGYAILVEGYMDCVSLYQYGVCNVAASLGTALTPEQARLLKRYTSRIVLCYDSDNAGIKAALRGIDVLRAAELEVKVLNVDDGKDPDEYVKRNGKDAFLKLVEEKALSDVEYKVKLLKTKYGSRNTGQQINFLGEIAGILRNLPPVEADIYIQKIAEEQHISEYALRREIERKAAEPAPQAKDSDSTSDGPKPKAINAKDIKLERLGIRLIMLKSEYIEELSAYPDLFVTNDGFILRQILESQYVKGQDFDINKLKDLLDESEYNYLKDIMDNVLVGDEESAFSDCIARLKSKKTENRLNEINETLKLIDSMPESEIDQEIVNKLLKEWKELQKK